MGLFEPQRGVLWKRRDVFKNSWRPRWFDLQPDQGLLTYYLLSSSTSIPIPLDSTIEGNHHPQYLPRSLSSPLPRDMIARTRATSWDSATSPISENSVDYDVVPRGTIYLWSGGCTVSINDSISRPQESLYAFTIRPSDRQTINTDSTTASMLSSEQATAIHLAARTPALRDIWVRKIHEVCDFGQSISSSNFVNSAAPASSTTIPPVPVQSSSSRRRRSSSRNRELFLQLQEPIMEETHADVYSNGSTNVDDSFTATEESSANQHPATGPIASRSDESLNYATPLLSWESEDTTSQESSVYVNVPQPLALRIRTKIDKYLAVLSAGHDDNDVTRVGDTTYQWKALPVKSVSKKRGLHKHVNLVAYQCWCSDVADDMNNKDGTKKYTLIKTEATLPHPSKQIFNLIADVSRRKDYETNIRHAERINVYNMHTFIDYYASNAVWPTAAREFTVATHWEVLTRSDGERAIVMISFSSPEAEACRPVAPDHVRGSLFLSMFLIRDMGDDTSHVTRLLSFDLSGNVNPHIASVVMSQQSSVLAVISDHLKLTEPMPFESRLRSSELLSNKDVIRNVVDNLLRKAEGRALDTTPRSNVISDSTRAQKNEFESANGIIADTGTGKDKIETLPSVMLQGIILFAPVVLYRVLILANLYNAAVPLFCIAVFAAVRQIMLMHLGTIARQANENNPGLNASIRFHFSVDLKGVLRFIANKKEERADLNADSVDVSVVHIVACAVARALKKQKELNYRRVTIPWLLIDEVVDSSSDPVDVSVFDYKSSKQRGIVTIQSADRLDVQSIANEMALTDQEGERNQELGQCLVLANSSNDDDDEHEMEIIPFPNSVFTVLAVIGKVRLERSVKKPSNGSHSAPPPPRPVLSVSLTIIPNVNFLLNDAHVCRSYSEEVRKLLQFPELCDG